MPFDLFLSYRTSHAPEVAPLLRALESAGVRVWQDSSQIRGGDSITDALRRALASARALAVYASADYLESLICAWELASAWIAAERGGEGRLRVLLLRPDGVDLKHVAHGPLLDCRAFDLPELAGDLDAVAASIARHIAQVDDRTLGELGRGDLDRTPASYPNPRSGSNHFIGRMGDLWRLHSLLQRSRQVGVTGQVGRDVTQVRGLIGIGKTLATIEYARRFDGAWPGGIFWIDADPAWAQLPESPQPGVDRRISFLAGLSGHVKVTPVPGDLAATARAVEAAIAEVTADRPYLWIVDNLPPGTTQAAIDALAPPGPRGALLVTTRWRALGSLGEHLDLGVLEPGPAFELLTLAAPPASGDEAEAARRLALAVGYHPLALDVLRALIPETLGATPYATWEARLADAGADLLEESALVLEEELPTGCEKAISRVLARSIEDRCELGLEVLRVATVLAPEPIPEDLVVEILGLLGHAAVQVEQAVRELATHALVRRDRERRTLDVHALVRRSVRYWGSPVERLEVVVEAAREVLGRRFGDTRDIRTHSPLRDLEGHAVVCAKGDTVAAAGIGARLGIYFGVRGDYTRARFCEERALAVREQRLGVEHADTLSVRQNLAVTLFFLGDYAGARSRYEQVLLVREARLGKEHRQTLATMQNLAVVLETLGEYGGARSLYEEALVISRRLLGDANPDTLMILHNLAGTLGAQGHLTEALGHQEYVFTARNDILGPEHPDTLTALHNVAKTRYELGDLDGALIRQRGVVAAREKILGPEHPHTLASLQSLAGIVRVLGDVKSARELFERVLEARERTLGADHPETTTTRYNLVLALLVADRPAAALHLEVLAALRNRPRDQLSAVEAQIVDALPGLLENGSQR